MVLDALKSIITAEEQADMQLAAALSEAKMILAQAEAQGRQMILTAEAEAEEAAEGILADAELVGAAAARDIAGRTLLECQALQSAAEIEMRAAIRMVVGRIVND